MANIKTPKKLIEVALPLDDINVEAAREKSIRHGHPSTLHLWWARRPLAAARAVLFAQLVNDPGYERHLGRGMNKEAAQKERERLFGIIRRLVKWENINNEEVLNEAREEIRKSWRETCELNKGIPGFDPDQLPAFHDPFAGGGAIPLEAQRLGLESYASDLNPVAVMINKAMIEIPPKFAGLPPVNPELRQGLIQMADDWKGARGLAKDIQYYGQRMRDEAYKRIGHLYPEMNLPEEYGGGKATVIAWLWARTVKSPNPAYSNIEVPLLSSYWLSSRSGKESYVEPVIDGNLYRFRVIKGKPRDLDAVKSGTKVGRGGNFVCLLSNTPISVNYIREEGKAGRIGSKLIAVVTESRNGRVYLEATHDLQALAKSAQPNWRPDVEINYNPRDIRPQLYGLYKYSDLFTDRQLLALNTFSELVQEVRHQVYSDALSVGMSSDQKGLRDMGVGALAYAEAVSVYLSFVVDKCSDYWSSLCSWHSSGEKMRNTFGRQAIPMVWDYAEANPFSDSTGNWMAMVDWVWKSVSILPSTTHSFSNQADAQNQSYSLNKVVSTDPPYYDNIGYADLSDYFYTWLRKSLRDIFPSIFATVAVPKLEELVATPYRHGSRENAEAFFLSGMTQVMHNIANNAHPAFPVSIYYAFKQSETEEDGTSSTGWITFLEAVIKSGFSIVGTWPMKTEMSTRMIGTDTNALASSIVLVCRQRSSEAASTSRRLFIRELNDALPESLEAMIGGKKESSPVAAVDLQQASIGPGMSVFSQYVAVLEADGSSMTVRTALQLINRVVDTYLNASDGELDADTLYCLNWFDQYGWNQGDYGQAEVLATAKGTTVEGMKIAGVLESGQGKVRLLKWQDYSSEWSPEQDNRTPVWEALHQLIRALQQQGEQATGALLAGMPARTDAVRNLAYRLYTLCERKGWADDARAYNELIASWDAIDAVAHEIGYHGAQLELF
ncbi:DUF1156 domain-containing protein [Paenibacillus ihuae]|uniref:DUF1156 domain-containing protein n=1 Tax=Paenibacillus ihuae TaxID=1232431 RepID=UPI0006D5435C|nr:DUF1156 domain-containing protein [Paenibacillus ihuae]